MLTGDSVDVYNGKAVRASAGSLFHLPVAVRRDPVADRRGAAGAGLTVLAADGYGEVDLDDAADSGLLAGPTAWLFGNEAWGLPDELGGARRPPGADPDPRPRREPQPRHRRGGLPLRQRPRPALTLHARGARQGRQGLPGPAA